jgi:hypoxanthine phosphoribosyltransferase
MKKRTHKSYDHEHTGLRRLTWTEFGEAMKQLAALVKREYDPTIVVGIAKGGVIVGAALATMLQVDFTPIRLSRREKGIVVRKDPALLVPPTDVVAGRRLLIVDDMCVTGHTFEVARFSVGSFRPETIKTCALARHMSDFRPDFCIIESDDMVIFPWAWEVLGDDCTFEIISDVRKEFDEETIAFESAKTG